MAIKPMLSWQTTNCYLAHGHKANALMADYKLVVTWHIAIKPMLSWQTGHLVLFLLVAWFNL